MPATVVVGTQWGDEGKGKFTDLVASEVSMVVRYQGGHNAGHTLVVDDETFALQLVPSGVLYPHVTPVIGNGVVVDPRVLLSEMDMLGAQGVDTAKLRVSGNAHLILPTTRSWTPSTSATWARTGWGPLSGASDRPTPTAPCGSAYGSRTSWTRRSFGKS